MPSPYAENFRRQYEQTTDPNERERLKQIFTGQVRRAFDPTAATNIMRETGVLIGEDMSHYLTAPQPIAALPPTQQQAVVAAGKEKATPIRRVLSATADAVTWWHENVTQPSAATALALAFNIIPGKSKFEQNIDRMRAEQGRADVAKGVWGRMGDFVDDATQAYRKTDFGWGVKGFAEFTFDPLILWGAGLPKLGAKVLPQALRWTTAPLRALDYAPVATLNKTLDTFLIGAIPRKLAPETLAKHPELRKVAERIAELAADVPVPILTRGFKDIPGLGKLALPHKNALTAQAFKQAYAHTAAAFGPRIKDLDKTVTREVLTGLDKVPQDMPLRQLLEHLQDGFKNLDRYETWLDSTMELPPAQAAFAIGEMARKMEDASIRLGGELLSGEVVTGISQRRVAGIQSFMEKMRLSDERAKWVGHQVDSFLQRAEDFAIHKLEPNITRPWATANLAFAGYMPFNVFDDVVSAVVGLGVHPFGFDDDLFLLLQTSGAAEANAPLDLLGATGHWLNTFDVMQGIYKRPRPEGFGEKTSAFIGDLGGRFGVRGSGRISAGLRRNSWGKMLLQEFDSVVAGQLTTAQTNELRALVRNLPPELKHLQDLIGFHATASLTTGDGAAIRAVGDAITPDKLLRKAQMGIIAKHPEFEPDIKALFVQVINKRGGVRPDNVVELLADTRVRLLDYLSYTPLGISARFDDLLTALAKREVRSPEESLALMRLLSSAEESLNSLPHEIRAWAAHKADTVPLNKRSGIWEESLKLADESVAEVRTKYAQALEAAKPQLEKHISAIAAGVERKRGVKSIVGSIYDNKIELSNSLQRTWSNYRAAVEEHFAKFPKGQRDEVFWRDFRNIGQAMWDTHRVERQLLSSQSRELWLDLLHELPTKLSAKGRSFVERSLWSVMEETDQALNQLQVRLIDMEAKLPTLTESFQKELQSQMATVEKAIQSTKVQRDSITEQLRVHSPGRRTLAQDSYNEFSKNVRLLEHEKRLATKVRPEDVPQLEQQLQLMQGKQLEYFESLLEPIQAREWHTIKTDSIRAQRFIDEFFAGATVNAIRGTRELVSRMAQRVIQGTAGKAPPTRNAVEKFVQQLAAAGDPDALSLVRGMSKVVDTIADVPATEQAVFGAAQTLSTTPRQVYERIYAKAHELAAKPQLTPTQRAALAAADGKDVIPDDLVLDLIQGGYLESDALARGYLRVRVTEAGKRALEELPVAPDIGDVLAELPPAIRTYETWVDEMVGGLQGMTDELVKTWDKPPITPAQQSLLKQHFGDLADHVERSADLQSTLRKARIEAGRRTNDAYTKFTVRYDSPTNFDYFMQRLMPFWMFESRRFPRLMRLASKRPILAKYFAGALTDQDFGYIPGPWGMDFSPLRGTMATTIRSVGRRDFPELYGGFRGALEEGYDWMARFGFFLKPEINAVVQGAYLGEPGGLMPPPVALLMHGLLATPGLDQVVPKALQDVVLNDRYTEFAINEAIADLFGESPASVRLAAERGDEEAMAKLDMGRREALRHMIVANQTSMARYRPQTRRDYVASTTEAISTYTGLSEKTLDNLKKLGVAYDEIITVSSAQKKAIREATDNYEAQISVSLALRPVEEQRTYWQSDKFWQAVDVIREENKAERLTVSSAWEQGLVNGPSARRMISDLNKKRSIAFDTLKNSPEYKSVAVTLLERQEQAAKFGRPPKLVSPIDEALEQYYSVSLENFTDPVTLEVDWEGFYNERDGVLAQWPDQVRVSVETEIARAETPLERALKQYAPALKRYWGVRSTIMGRLPPQIAQAQKEYNRLANLAAFATDPREYEYYLRLTRQYLQSMPSIALAEAQVRWMREELRRQDPEVAKAYQLFVRSV